MFFHYIGQEILHAALPTLLKINLPMMEEPMIQFCHLPGISEKWAEQLKASNSVILNAIAEQQLDSMSDQPLSYILEAIASFLPQCPNSGSEEWNDTLASSLGFLQSIYT
jgi:hypothetical protein